MFREEDVPLLPPTEEVSELYGSIRAELEVAGRIIGNKDPWMAAPAMAAEWILVTGNEREFRHVRGLKLENWAK